MATLKCLDLWKSFDGVQALKGMTFEVSRGLVAVIGPNGAGKTTLINAITGFVRPERGQILLDGKELIGLAPHLIVRRGVARTFQDLRLISEVSAWENILLARPNQSGETLFSAVVRRGVGAEEAQNRDDATRWLGLVGLGDVAGVLVRELSYGQQKLLSLACCMATNAEVLLLDEPVAGVHAEMALRILEVLRGLRDRGRQIVFIEHDIGFVRQGADQVVVMDGGRVIAQGAPADVLSRPEIIDAYVG